MIGCEFSQSTSVCLGSNGGVPFVSAESSGSNTRFNPGNSLRCLGGTSNSFDGGPKLGQLDYSEVFGMID